MGLIPLLVLCCELCSGQFLSLDFYGLGSFEPPTPTARQRLESRGAVGTRQLPAVPTGSDTPTPTAW